MKKGQATAEVFFTAFKSLKGDVREAFLKKIINDRTLREDLIDIALIEKAKKVRGTPMSAKKYFKKPVALSYAAWKKIKEELEELEDIRAYDKAKAQPSNPVSFDVAVKKIRKRKLN